MVRTYKELIVWQKSIILVKEIYLLSSHFPKTEVFGLTSQMQRAAVSIPSNIAEGFSRGSGKEFQHFLSISFGSARELETQLIIAKEIKYIDDACSFRVQNLLQEILKMLYVLRRQTLSTVH